MTEQQLRTDANALFAKIAGCFAQVGEEGINVAGLRIEVEDIKRRSLAAGVEETLGL